MNTDLTRRLNCLYKLLKVKYAKDLKFALEKSHSKNYFICVQLRSSVDKLFH